jgi:hypothetical protein
MYYDWKPYKSKLKVQVIQLDKKTNKKLNTYGSAAEACRAVGGGQPSNIVLACRGKVATAYKYKWRYANKEVN